MTSENVNYHPSCQNTVGRGAQDYPSFLLRQIKINSFQQTESGLGLWVSTFCTRNQAERQRIQISKQTVVVEREP